MHPHKTLGLFESEAQLTALLNWSAGAGVTLTLAALTAQADYAAARRGLTYTTFEDYIDEKAMMAEGFARYAVMEDFCGWLDEALAAAMPDAGVPAWFSARDYIYSLKNCYDILFFRTVGLIRLIEAERPGRVIAFQAARRDGHPADTAFWHVWRSTFMAALPLVAVARGAAVGLLPNPEPYPAPYGPPTSPPDVWAQLEAQLQAYRAGRPDPARVLTLGLHWSDRETVPAAQRRGLPMVRLDTLRGPNEPVPAERQARFDRFWEQTEQSPEWARLFTFDGVNVAGLAAPVFASLIRNTAPWQQATVARLAERFRQIGDAVLLVSSMVFTPNVAALRAARLAGIPGVLQQHGGLWYFRSPIVYYAELLLPDYYLCYGEGSAAAIRAIGAWHAGRIDGRAARPVSVGCSKTAATWRRHYPAAPPPPAPDRGLRVLYVSSTLSGEEFYMSGSRHADIRYWRLQRDAVAHCAALPGVELTVRPGRGEDPDNPFRAWLKNSGTPCRLSVGGSLDPLLDDADVIIIDYTSSVVLQAVATRAQVVSLLWEEPVASLEPGAEEALSRRAWVPRNRADFLAAIDAAVDAARTGIGLRPLDETFLKLYAFDPAIDPVERAAELLAALPRRAD